MRISVFTSRADTKNARAGALALGAAAFMTLLLSHFSLPLAPLRLLTLVMVAFAVWAFCDEMGMKKPLNRAAFVFFSIAVVCKLQITLGVSVDLVGRYNILYTAFLLIAMLFWSAAFLHRKKSLKIVGAVGLIATVSPIVAIVAGHLVVGFGAVIGIDALLEAANSTGQTDFRFVVLVERMFGLWAYVAAWLLWRGHIVA